MFPLRDDNPISITPVVAWALIAVNTAVFLYQISLPPDVERHFVHQFGAIPALITSSASLAASKAVLPPVMTLFTSMFLHGSWMHLVGNMWFLWIFGNNIEDAMGHLRFLAFYLICGILASLSHIFSYPESAIPSIGASGAIAGALGAYLLLYPRARVWTLIFLGFFVKLIYIPAGVILGFWILLQFVSGSVAGRQEMGGVAFWAHIGGFVAGILLTGLFKKSSVRFFNPSRRREIGYY
jgi:membrane associated rhomboid family serine protease